MSRSKDMEEKNKKPEYHGSMRRLAKNTLLLYLRQIIIMAVSLYTVRVVLQVLGVSDYGIYSVVGSFVAFFNIISGAISVAITRYMALAVGEGDVAHLRLVYTTSVWLQMFLGALIMLLIAVIGGWYVSSVMVMPAGREGAALAVMLMVAVSFWINLLNVPHTAMIVAHEAMKVFAYIALMEAALKLFTVVLLAWVAFDKLIAYGALILLSTTLVSLIYFTYCRRHYAECRMSMTFDRRQFFDMLGFIKWAFLGNGAVIVREHGISMILNIFGGTTVSAARGLAQGVNGAVASFTDNYIRAAQPQITKLFGSGAQAELCAFICRSSKYSFFLMLTLSLPLIKNTDYVLSLWLGSYPEYTAIFIVWTLLDGLTNSINQPLLYGTLAEGRIRAYELMLTALFVSSLPLSYVILSLGFSPVAVYVLLFSLRLGVFAALLQQSYRYGMRRRLFVKKVLLRLFVVTAVAGSIVWWMDFSCVLDGFGCFIAESAAAVAVVIGSAFALGMEGEERASLRRVVSQKLMARVRGR